MKILVIMQNQWFKDPVRAGHTLERLVNLEGKVKGRNRFVASMLFMGCKTGNVIRRVFGDLLEMMDFDEAHPELGASAKSNYGFDVEHIRWAIEARKPGIILALGKVAQEGVKAVLEIPDLDTGEGVHVVTAPHPAARQRGTIDQIKAARGNILNIMSSRVVLAHDPGFGYGWPACEPVKHYETQYRAEEWA